MWVVVGVVVVVVVVEGFPTDSLPRQAPDWSQRVLVGGDCTLSPIRNLFGFVVPAEESGREREREGGRWWVGRG